MMIKPGGYGESVCSSRSILRIRSLTCAIFSSYQALQSTEIVTMNNNMDSVAQIKFKNIPFYEVIDEVIKPTLLIGTDRCTLQDVSRGMKEATFKFIMSVEHANLVAGNRYYSYGKYEYPYQFQIRICQLIEPVPNESPDDMPLSLLIRVNMQKCPLPPTATPINCTEKVKLSPIVANNIAIHWTPDRKKYVFAMFLVKKITVDTLLKKLQDKDGISSEDTKNDIGNPQLDSDDDEPPTKRNKQEK
ncbi:hypothetical protein AGLY_018281 [Aphis glycines]|uniref:PINIT domain-containing protein n=1 Tax=Aphis glycines TaxID=307491 RepID=A0A6G0SSI8_APHGL|nr:hypothetical protein AGLY_018281 [Aphis glycines]